MKLSIKDLCFGYNGSLALEDIALDVSEGQIVSLVGPNGAGKSTLLKCIDRILKPNRGSVLVDGRDLARMSGKEISRSMGYVPQSTAEVFPYTVFDIVMMGRRPHIGWRVTQRDISVVAETLRFMGIERFSSRYFDELSGGEKQKIAMARALAQEPKILLLDEPTSNLDILHQLELMKTIERLVRERGISAVMAMHDLNLASRFSHRVVMLKDRMIHEIGPPKEVLTQKNINFVYGVRAEVLVGCDGRPYIIPLEAV